MFNVRVRLALVVAPSPVLSGWRVALRAARRWRRDGFGAPLRLPGGLASPLHLAVPLEGVPRRDVPRQVLRGRGRPPHLRRILVSQDRPDAAHGPRGRARFVQVHVRRVRAEGHRGHRRARGSSFAVLRGLADPRRGRHAHGKATPRAIVAPPPRIPPPPPPWCATSRRSADAATMPCSRSARRRRGSPATARKSRGWKSGRASGRRRCARAWRMRASPRGRARATGGTLALCRRALRERTDRPERTTTRERRGRTL